MKLLLAGCGNLGGNILSIYAKHSVFEEIVVIEPSLSKAQQFSTFPNIAFKSNINDISVNFRPDIIILAFKPQQFSEVLPQYERFVITGDNVNNPLFISFAAGISLNTISNHLKNYNDIVRIMPNIGLSIGESTNLMYAEIKIKEKYNSILEKIFSITGKTIWLENEKMIEDLTPISGSGPAYFFLLCKILSDIMIEKLNMQQNIAQEIAEQILVCSAEIITNNKNNQNEDNNHHFTTLLNKVASKKGVTEAALIELNKNLPEIFCKAYTNAMSRLNELDALLNK